jgi:hypothetical protein
MYVWTFIVYNNTILVIIIKILKTSAVRKDDFLVTILYIIHTIYLSIKIENEI